MPESKGRKTKLARAFPGASGEDVPFELTVMDGPDLGKTFPLEGKRIQVGYGEENDIRLTDEAVSRVHFALEKTDKGYRLLDLGSTNGTQLDGIPVVEAFLPPGAEVWVGETRLRFQPRRG